MATFGRPSPGWTRGADGYRRQIEDFGLIAGLFASRLRSRVGDASEEQNRSVSPIPDREQERVVGAKHCRGLVQRVELVTPYKHHRHGGCRRGFGGDLVHLDERLVEHLRYEERVCLARPAPVDPRKVGESGIERIHDA